MKTACIAAVIAVGLLAGPVPAQMRRPAPDSVQIAAATLPLPAEFRTDATVLGYRDGTGGLVPLRRGGGAFTCIAHNPAAERFHVACYHRSLEPFMARGRALRAQGVGDDQVDSTRNAEVQSGRLRMPSVAALYSLTGGSYDATTNTAPGARPLLVIYTPGATPESTGLSATPSEGTPWLMFPGRPNAHIMLVPRM